MAEFTALLGLEVEQIWVWGSTVRLVFDLGTDERHGAHIDLTDFRYTDAAREQWDVRVDDDPLTAGAVLGLLHRRVTGARVQDWELAITFDDNAHITCPPQDAYEAWEACFLDENWYCPPGGMSTEWPHP